MVYRFSDSVSHNIVSAIPISNLFVNLGLGLGLGLGLFVSIFHRIIILIGCTQINYALLTGFQDVSNR